MIKMLTVARTGMNDRQGPLNLERFKVLYRNPAFLSFLD